MRVVGVDGCKGGWVAVELDLGRFSSCAVCPSFQVVLDAFPESRAFGVDVPIGLPRTPGRPADVEASRYLGGRAASVFATYPAALYRAPTYEAARDLCVARGWPRITRQSYGLARAILEVERRRRDERVFEVHPEVSFKQLAGRRLPAKTTWEGFFARRRYLARQGILLPDELPGAPLVDTLDAAVAAWTAARFVNGIARPLPEGHVARLGAIWR